MSCSSSSCSSRPLSFCRVASIRSRSSSRTALRSSVSRVASIGGTSLSILGLGRCSRGRACSAFNGSAIELPSRIDLERRPFLVDREKQVERCPLADFAVHANETADLLRQGVHLRDPETRAAVAL